MSDNFLPLELYLKKVAENNRHAFPITNIDYFTRYVNILDYLRSNIYPNINVGLTVNSDDRINEDPVKSLYTSHGPEHFDEVVKYAGQILGLSNDNIETCQIDLEPFEVFALLVAIRIHDAGNISGRDGHTMRCLEVLRQIYSNLNFDQIEMQRIAKIAAAHGGKTKSGSKDTISLLEERRLMAGSTKLRERLLAGIVRIADEICENSDRVAKYLLAINKVPNHSLIYHKYGEAIKANVIENHILNLIFEINVKETKNKFLFLEKGNDIEIYLIDYIYERLEKMDLERVYCNKFIQKICPIDKIQVTIKIVDDYGDDVLEPISIILDDIGYPSSSTSTILDSFRSNFNGDQILQNLEKFHES